ncbi:DUF4339 domain-containing protein [Gimesia maris]|uniref:DUF4339 domain-containing protein n=1 Tax=Gimesia maris TaxID=122 RepID=UPI003A95D328
MSIFSDIHCESSWRKVMTTEWYFSNNGDQLGPVPADQMQALVLSGEISSTTLVWREGMAQWEPAEKVDGLLNASNHKRPVPPPLSKVMPPNSSAVISSQLTELQDKLLEGQIDKEMYEMLKQDLLYANKQSKSDSTDSAMQEISQTNSESKVSPWVTGKICMDGKGGSSELKIDVYLDDELIGTGSEVAGIHIDFESSTGHHTLKLNETNKDSAPFFFRIDKNFVHPLHFDASGHYEIQIEPGSFWEQFKDQLFKINVIRSK